MVQLIVNSFRLSRSVCVFKVVYGFSCGVKWFSVVVGGFVRVRLFELVRTSFSLFWVVLGYV